MRAAGLHAIATVLSSQAVLITPSKPHKSLTPELEPLIGMIKSRLAGVIASQQYVLCNYNIHESKLQMACAITPGRRAATVSKLEETGWMAVSAMIEKKKQAEIMDDLTAAGAEDILVLSLNNCRV